MDTAFKYTNFGVVSLTHGDYFLNTKAYKPGDILTHVTHPFNKFKDTIILFPEGNRPFLPLILDIIWGKPNRAGILWFSGMDLRGFLSYSELILNLSLFLIQFCLNID